MLLRITVLLLILWCGILPRQSAAQGDVDTLPLRRDPVAKLSYDIAFPALHPPQPSVSFPSALPPQPEYEKICYRVRGRQFIAPSILLGLGATGVTVAKVKLWDDMIHSNFEDVRRSHFDNYLQYAPLAAPYLMKLSGIRSRHGYGEYTILLATSYLSVGIMVNTLKYTVGRERPDGSSRTSFPSGHTATAFMGAELMRSEFWEVSPWIGVGGYSLAVTIGFMRVYNGRHWVTDVIAGAGIGILSVRIAYWTLPALRKLFRGDENRKQNGFDGCVSIVPYYDGNRFGAAFGVIF